jgi:hypothetical protein
LEGIHTVHDQELQHMLEDLLYQLLQDKANGIDIIDSHGGRLCCGLHDFQGGPETVLEVPHQESGVGLQVAFKFPTL